MDLILNSLFGGPDCVPASTKTVAIQAEAVSSVASYAQLVPIDPSVKDYYPSEPSLIGVHVSFANDVQQACCVPDTDFLKRAAMPEPCRPAAAKTFADILQLREFVIESDKSHVPSSPNKAVKVNHEVLQKHLDLCKHSKIGRVILAKEYDPWNLVKLRERLTSMWSLSSAWWLINLGKGYYHTLLTFVDDKDKVWARGSLKLRPGVLRLQQWSFGFDPLKEKTMHAQIWIHLYHLPWSLWEPSIIDDLARHIGTLKFDKNTLEGDFGHYARMLVDVDLAKADKA